MYAIGLSVAKGFREYPLLVGGVNFATGVFAIWFASSPLRKTEDKGPAALGCLVGLVGGWLLLFLLASTLK